MINEQECTRILNEGRYKFSHEEMLQIREFLMTLAQIEIDLHKQNQRSSDNNECYSLHQGKYR